MSDDAGGTIVPTAERRNRSWFTNSSTPRCHPEVSLCPPVGSWEGAGETSEDRALTHRAAICRPEKRCGSELSRDRLGRVEWHYLSPLFQKNKSTFLNYTPACIIGITHPRPSARQASIELGLRPRSINYADKLPVFTGPVWLCAHPPLQAVRKAQTHIYRAAVDWSLPAGRAPPSGYLDKERVGRSRLLSAGVGEGDPYMVSERRLEV